MWTRPCGKFTEAMGGFDAPMMEAMPLRLWWSRCIDDADDATEVYGCGPTIWRICRQIAWEVD